jgi:hypothetical protein
VVGRLIGLTNRYPQFINAQTRLPAISGWGWSRLVEKFIKDFRPLRQQREAFPHFTDRSHDGCESPPRGTHVDEPAGSPAMVLAQAR